VHIRFEGGANLLQYLYANRIRRFLKNAADGTESSHVVRERVLRNRARHIDRLNLDFGPTATFEDPTDTVGIPERELLDATIKQLTTMRDGLRHAAACRAPSHIECPTFQRLLRAAASGNIRPSERSTPQRRASRTTS